jgi:hypothetical protein
MRVYCGGAGAVAAMSVYGMGMAGWLEYRNKSLSRKLELRQSRGWGELLAGGRQPEAARPILRLAQRDQTRIQSLAGRAVVARGELSWLTKNFPRMAGGAFLKGLAVGAVATEAAGLNPDSPWDHRLTHGIAAGGAAGLVLEALPAWILSRKLPHLFGVRVACLAAGAAGASLMTLE